MTDLSSPDNRKTIVRLILIAFSSPIMYNPAIQTKYQCLKSDFTFSHRRSSEGENMMMCNVKVVLFFSFILGLVTAFPASAQQASQEKAREGYYEITLRTPDKRKIVVDELVRDRDLDPASLYRVKTGGYLSFEEPEWVDKIEFKVYDVPVTDLPLYKRYAELLSEINQRIWVIKVDPGFIARYDILALHLMNICDKTRFPDLQSIDENISEYLTSYKKLELLRSLVVNSLNRFVRDRSCRDQYAEYSKTLELYKRQLAEVTKNIDRMTKRAISLTQEAKPTLETRPEAPSAPATTPPERR